MTSIPPNLTRVPNLLASQISLAAIRTTNRDLLGLHVQLASGRRVNRPSEDSVAAGLITTLDEMIERRGQRLRNLSHAGATLNTVDAAIGDATDILHEARSIASSQVGLGSDPTTREQSALVIDAMIAEMVRIANRRYQDVHLFGGEATAAPPMSDRLGGLRYGGSGEGAVTDLGLSRQVTITASGEEVFGALSARIHGAFDLDPSAVPETRLVDLDGALGEGIRLSNVEVDVNGTVYDLDLSDAASIGDVVASIQDLLDTNEPGALGAGGVGIDPLTGDRISIDVSPGFTIMFTDPGGAEGAAADLGLTDAVPFQDGTKEVGADFRPRLTDLTPIASLAAVAGPLGTLRITNGGQSRDVDLSGATTVRDVINAVAALNVGVRVEIADSGDRLDFINELSGGEMSIAEVSGGTTATSLGVRTLGASTLLSDFNHGRGVEIISGAVDPVTGLPDPAADLDFRVTLKDGRSFDVDLGPATTSVQEVLDAMNAAAGVAGVTVPAEFEAHLAADGNGIALTDNTAGATTSVTALNGSHAAEHLGILGSSGSATLIGEDRATVAVESVFSHLMALRDALRADDTTGITIAGDRFEGDLTRLARSRAVMGVHSRVVADAIVREEDLTVQDEALRSEVRDLDFTEAAVRFATLQQQLQAALTTAARLSSMSLLDFLR